MNNPYNRAIEALQENGFDGDTFNNYQQFPSTIYLENGMVCRRIAMEDPDVILQPGEYGFTGRLSNCSVVITRLGEDLAVCHDYPKTKTTTLRKYLLNLLTVSGKSYEEALDLINLEIETPILEDSVVIGRVPFVQANLINKLSIKPAEEVFLPRDKVISSQGDLELPYASVVIYNNPDTKEFEYRIKVDDFYVY